MEPETAKVYVPLIAGLLALIGGVLTFVNGRLNDAKTQEGRELVIFLTWTIIACTSTIIGATCPAIGRPLLGTPFLVLALAINICIFLKGDRIIGRAELASFIVNCGVLIASSVAFPLMHMIDRLLATNNQLLSVLEQMTTGNAEVAKILSRLVDH